MSFLDLNNKKKRTSLVWLVDFWYYISTAKIIIWRQAGETRDQTHDSRLIQGDWLNHCVVEA